jgi:hypothetical protein
MSKKPNWAPNAVATSAGWVNPDTNELLVSARGLPGALPYIKGRIIRSVDSTPTPKVAEAAKEVVDAVVAVSEEVQEVVAQAVEEVVEAVAAPVEKKSVGSKKKKK